MSTVELTRSQASTYDGIEAVALETAKSQAILLPSMGGNLISLRDTERDLSFLCEPLEQGQPSVARYRERPFTYGIPILFPPNRIADGQFVYGGHTYHFPINEPDTGNHLHGFLYDKVWEVTEIGSDDSASWVTEQFELHPEDETYGLFPHESTYAVRYLLRGDSLVQTVEVCNKGTHPMPLMLGFHTAFRVPFHVTGRAADYVLRVEVGDQWVLNERKLPQTQQATELERQLRNGVQPFIRPLDSHFDVVKPGSSSKAELQDTDSGVTLTYEVDAKYLRWMVWNDDAGGSRVCVEPMTCVVNAPNLSLPATTTGLVGLEPGETWSAVSKISWRS